MSTFPLPGANWTYLHSFYVLKPSGDQSGITDAANLNAAVSSLPASGGTVYLAAGQWYVLAGQVTVSQSGVYFRGAGKWATFVNGVGTGDVFRMFDSSTYGSRTVFAGGFTGLTVDGTNTGAGSSGLHIGDIPQLELDISVQNFTGAGSMGVHLDNAYFWTEQCHGLIQAQNCASHVVFDCTAVANTATGSFDRSDLTVYVNQGNPAFDGVVFQAGSLLVDGKLTIAGNFGSSNSALTSAVLRITGQTPVNAALSSFSQILKSLLHIGVEAVAANANRPQTIVFGSASNLISTCYGVMDFSNGGTFAASNNANNLQRYYGDIAGDTALHTWLVTGRSNNALGSAQAITSTTAAAVTSMTAVLTPFTTYVIRAWIPYTSTSVAGIPVFSFTGPAGNINVNLMAKFYSGGVLASIANFTSYTAAINGPTLTNSTNLLMEIEGTIEVSGSGTLQLTAAEGTAGDSFSISKGAYMTAQPLAN